MTVIYNPNTGIIAKIIFKIEIKKKKEFESNNSCSSVSFVSTHFPSGLYCVEWLKRPHHSLNGSQIYLRADTRDEVEVVNVTEQRG